jgi:hypothetical protein
MNIEQICTIIINHYTKTLNQGNEKKQCSCCKINSSLTWRPGPVGSRSLCNACGLKYKKNGERPRMIDLVLLGQKATWIKRNNKTLEWQEYAADENDPRLMEWKTHEINKNNFVKAKKRKLTFF